MSQVGAGQAECCERLLLSSGGMGDFYQGELLGSFIHSGTSSSGRPVYRQVTDRTDQPLREDNFITHHLLFLISV